MTLTIDVEETSAIRITDADVTAEGEETLAFVVEGVVRVGGGLLKKFAGASLTPVAVELRDDGDEVEIDLSNGAALRLDAVDVGVERPGDGTPDPSELAADAIDNPTDAPDVPDGRISFTVEGIVEDVPADVVEYVSQGDPTPRSITFAVDDSVATDGGSPESPLASVELLGFRIAVLADGTITVSTADSKVDVGPL